ncbi:MAG: shikimate dehydrogenase [Pseudomonadota bacterium]
MTAYAEVIGDPISHSKSPLIHNFWLEKLGIDAEYRAMHVHPGELPAYFAQRRADAAWRGCNVTLPHKVATMALVDQCSALVSKVGAVNTVVRNGDGTLDGGNTDATGFAEPLQGRHFDRVTVIGAGGAARAVLAGLTNRRISWVSILNRDVAKAAALLEEFGLNGCALELDAEVPIANLLVNASSLGMVGQPELPPVERYVADTGTVYDLVYAPLQTRLLAASRARGVEVIDGLVMLVAQAAEAFSAFFGQPAPRQHDAELRALLTR